MPAFVPDLSTSVAATLRSRDSQKRIRRDLIIGAYLAWAALGVVHVGTYWFFPAAWSELNVYIWGFYPVFGLTYVVSRWAPLRWLLPFELASSGLNAYAVCAVGGLESQLHLLFVVMAMRCYLLFHQHTRYIWLSYGYYTILLIVGYHTGFMIPGWESPTLDPEVRRFLGEVVVVAQAPIMLSMIQAAIQRTRQERDLFYQLERESVRLEKRLAKQSELQRLIFEQSFDAQFLVEAEHLRIVDCNLQAVTLFQGGSKASFLGRRGLDFGFRFWDREELRRIKHAITKHGQYCAELEYRTLRGKRFWGMVAIRQFQWEGEEFLIVRIADITQRKADQAAIQQKNIELERYIASNLQLENFAYMASHDLKEPLRSIVAFAQLLQRRYGDQLDASGQEFIQHIVTAGQNLDQLIRALLSYSRVQSEEVKMSCIDLPEMLAEVLRELGPLIREKGAQIEVDPDLPADLYGDPVRIRQLWQNLITNALKFHCEGEAPQVMISGRERSQGWRFWVSDRGIGISAEDRERVFVLFKRLHGKNAYQGTGIGLALCRRIVDQHQGRIWIETPEDDRGTRFCFELNTRRPSLVA